MNKKPTIDIHENAIRLWKELGLSRVDIPFSCGGDSMNDLTVQLIGQDGEQVSNDELESYFDDQVYNRVEFYVNSDGHYQGEAGTVEVTLDDEDEDFHYCKSSMSEWSEQIENETSVALPVGSEALIKAKVLNINGGEGENPNFNYKQDCIITDDEEKLLEAIGEAVQEAASDFSPETDEEVSEWYTYSTNDQNEEIRFTEQGELVLRVRNSITVYTEE